MNTLTQIIKKVFNKENIDENETFVTLIQVALENQEIKESLLNILSLDNFNRKSALNTFIEHMTFKQAPKKFVTAIACLIDDAVAQKALKILSNS
ncbi:MAG: hypothetical protein HQK79_14435 [Desulfobacterales bacterium]|nr:hypothetical protein [Desulfobacterales bacterium]MBF0397412.1 hypothetical protein [Desulfobacterales bacterium]